jgi:hypothetical protein
MGMIQLKVMERGERVSVLLGCGGIGVGRTKKKVEDWKGLFTCNNCGSSGAPENLVGKEQNRRGRERKVNMGETAESQLGQMVEGRWELW